MTLRLAHNNEIAEILAKLDRLRRQEYERLPNGLLAWRELDNFTTDRFCEALLEARLEELRHDRRANDSRH